MKFTKLRIAGFKTFVEPTELIIEDGLTGVVGPNGCGKSNLVEAMRWVMGESSYKAMRAGGMEEVIFSGSGGRPSRNSAEVKLFLDNAARRAPAAFNEHEQLEVSRRIERDKGSSYRVNGREVRARDVQLMFADAASGARSPSMVRQGQIGELISAKPVQRRTLLEEAAGISGLHTRRHEAELRLRAAETNIERLDDVVGELERQLEALRRQARQAARFREIAARTRAVEAGVYALKWAAADQGANEANEALRQAIDVLALADEAQLVAATAQASAAASVPDARTKAAEAGAALGRILRARDELALEERQISERLDNARAQLATLDVDMAREAQLANDHAVERDTLLAEMEVLKAAQASCAALEGEREDAAQKTGAALNEALAASNAARDVLSAARANRAASARLLENAQANLARIHSQHQGAQTVLAELSVGSGVATTLDTTRQRASALKAAQEEATQQVLLAEIARTQALAELAQAETPLRAREKQLAQAQAEIAALEKLVEARSSAPTSLDPVMDAISVAPGYEAALGAALGEALEASCDPLASQFWVALQGSAAPLPEGAEPLLPFVRAPRELQLALAHIGIVDEASGQGLQGALQPGQMLVSLKGTLWRWDGLVGRTDRRGAAALKLAERNRLEELRRAANVVAADVEALAASHLAALAALGATDTVWSDSRTKEASARQALDQASSALIAIERQAEREAARLAGAQADLSRLEEASQLAQRAVEEAKAQRRDGPDILLLEAALSAAAQEEARLRQAHDEALAKRDQLLRERADLGRRQQNAQRGLEAWQRRADAASSHGQTLAARRLGLIETMERLDGEPGRLVEKRRALATSLASAEVARSQSADRLAQLETALREADTRARTIKEAYFAAREAHGRCEERKAAADERSRALEATILEAVDVAPHGLMALAGFATGKQPPSLEALERELGDLKEARARLGAVNLAAEQEADDVAQRRDTLVMERDDVAEAIARLRVSISTLNREGRAKLLEAFERVNTQFGELFTRLFGGGEAELKLIDADDPLDAGLEIYAKPPGKKPQSITLLSGGEQALTAMALIFAVFLSNPAPICILDEVDAPLDDTNVERFCDLLDDMAARTSTRFMVVTHNPITMSRMHRLFGVTMAERGVSQIVSVALAQAEAMVQTESAA